MPSAACRLKGRSMRLKPGEGVEWHTTGAREEVLIILGGSIRLDLMPPRGPRASRTLSAGRCAFLPRRVRHRVVNRSRRVARYLYITG